MPKKIRHTAISPEWPFWYDPLSPLGSAVRHVASLSPRFHWVGIYELKGKVLKLGPYIGAPTEHTSIRVGKGVCGTAVLENKDQNVPDVQSCSNYLACSVETKSELVVLIRDRSGRILGQIDIDSHVTRAFGPSEHEAVSQIAKELGDLWPAQKSRS
ncbi:MAG: GAF domain-containing protein [Bdellovibrionota bacterium]